MISAQQDLASPCEHAVHGPGDSRRDGAHSISQRVLAGGFDEKMYVIALHGVVHDTKGTTLVGDPEGPPQLLQESLPAQ